MTVTNTHHPRSLRASEIGPWDHGYMDTGDIPTISVVDLPSEDVPLLDVREDYEWQAGHAPHAVHIPLGELPARLDELAKFPEGKPIYVVCRSGGRSARAAAWLTVNGWDAVNVAGGMKSWLTEGRAVVNDPQTAAGKPPEIL